ncbi:MAG: hypothetical protein JST79_15260 [Acidobacteria bacterium]|nr:hypothetical protein [Acidobacteriota bacterium]
MSKAWFVACVVCLVLAPAFAQSDAFLARLQENRYDLAVHDGEWSGSAAPVLREAMARAQYILLGEDHGLAEIPAFATAVCTLAGPQGFHTLAVETGPLAAEALTGWVGRKDGTERLVAFEKQYPATIAFYNFQQEFDWLSHCAQKARGGQFHLWGLDQELMGASGLILARILETHPGKNAEQAVRRLMQKNDQAYAAASQSGSPGEIFMMSASDDELKELDTLLHKEANPAAQGLFRSLLVSREIYQKNMNGSGFDSNRQRALLMKTNFEWNYQQALRSEGGPPKILFKFGAWHVYKGFNPLHNNDLGNLVAELADGQGTQSLHIAVLAVKGSQLRFAGIGRPFQPVQFNLAEDKDSDFPYLKPLFERQIKEGWTVFDLRGLRRGFRSLGPVDKDLERLIFGCDFLVLIPQGTPSRQMP